MVIYDKEVGKLIIPENTTFKVDAVFNQAYSNGYRSGYSTAKYECGYNKGYASGYAKAKNDCHN